MNILNRLQPKIKNKYTILSILLILVLIGAILASDTLRFKKLLFIPDKLTETSSNGENSLANPDLSNPIPTKEVICEYIDTLQTEVTKIDPDDKIQKNIGYQNNKVGIYIYAEVSDFVDLAGELVNSNGGDWGYVLIPFNVKETNGERWGKLFMKLSDKHLIPIIQLWDLDLEDNKMDKQIRESAQFLNSLKWPIKQRYISVYNEPNDASFWKGEVNPTQYAEVLNKTIQTFKALKDDYFILNGAFNASARSGGGYIDEETFLIKMNDQYPGIFKKLDGWASHSYPQPNFSGSPSASGRDSIKAYEWELSLLKRHFGVDISNLPVFITETGWAHRDSEALDDGEDVSFKFNKYQVADNMKYAFEKVWLTDSKVVAVTPFTIRYDPPHDHFSWITENNNSYPQFDAVKNIKKVKGKPQIVNYYKSKVLECR